MDYIAIAQQYVAEHYPTIVYGKPLISELPPGTAVGSWHYSYRSAKDGIRFIINRKPEIVPGVMPGDVYRAWLRDQYELPIKRRKSQMADEPYPQPTYAKVGK